MAKYNVQILLVKEINVEASDELQAERAAYQSLKKDRHNAIGMHVQEHGKPGEGAMSDNNIRNMAFVKEYFSTIDETWCEGESL